MNAFLRMALFGILLTCANVLRSQPVQFILPVINQVETGTVVTLPVKAVNFDSVLSAQFVIRWDPAVLSFFSVSGFNLPNLNGQAFNLTNALDSGFIRFAWESPNNIIGTSKPDSTVIFRLKFSVTGPLLSGSDVKITEYFPTFFEITKVGPVGGMNAINIQQVILTQGYVAVGYTLDANEPARKRLQAKLVPNPVQTTAQLLFDLPKTSEVFLTITDPLGRVLEQMNLLNLPQGQNVLDLPNIAKFDPGLYYLNIRTAQYANVLSFFKF